MLAGLALAVLLLLWGWWGLPARGDVRALVRANPGPTALMRQREQEAAARGGKARRAQQWVPASRISRHLVHAVLAAEDQKFFGHEGVDWDAIKESAEKDVKAGHFVAGGSTITQQLAKNLYFGTGKTPLRKLRELVVARWLEQDLSKRRILELYLNVIEWGDGIYGAEAASRAWFGKPAAALEPAEAAGLAAMIPNPRRLNPRVNPTRHARAQRRVLWLMAQAGFLGRSGIGAEPPPVPADDDEPDEVPGAAAAPEATPTAPSSTPTPVSTPPPSPAEPGAPAPSPADSACPGGAPCAPATLPPSAPPTVAPPQ